MIATSTVIARRYEIVDDLTHLMPEYANYKLDSNMTWVAEIDGEIVGAILAAGGNQTAVILRMVAVDNAPTSWALATLRYMATDLYDQGYLVITACLSAARPAELKLARMMQRGGGMLGAISGYIAVASLAKLVEV